MDLPSIYHKYSPRLNYAGRVRCAIAEPALQCTCIYHVSGPQYALRLTRLDTRWSHWLGIGAIGGLVDKSTCAEFSDYETHDLKAWFYHTEQGFSVTCECDEEDINDENNDETHDPCGNMQGICAALSSDLRPM